MIVAVKNGTTSGSQDNRISRENAEMKFDIEHIGICVEKPIEMANWYYDTLGFNIKFCAEDEEKGVAFITDGSDKVMLELGENPRCFAPGWQIEPPPAVAYRIKKRRS